MNNAQNQFTLEIAIDRDSYGAPVIYVDDKNRAGKTYTFGDFAQACDALEDWKRIAQVIVPADGLWRHVRGFQTELRGRKDRKSEHEKLAQRLARIRAGLTLDARQRYRFEGEDLVKFNLQYEDTRRMTMTALKAALRNEDMTLVAAQTKAKAKTEAKAGLRTQRKTAQADVRTGVIQRAMTEGKNEVIRNNVITALAATGRTAVPVMVEDPVAVG